MSNNSTVKIPTPVGGIPMHVDAVPSIIFSVLYGLMFPVIVYRAVMPKMRFVNRVNCTLFAIERIVVFAMRATQALNPDRRTSTGLLKYLQLSFATGFISTAQDAVPLLRCLIVNATHGPDPLEPRRSNNNEDDNSAKRDLPRTRFWTRRLTDLWNWAWTGAIVPGVISCLRYRAALTDQKVADDLQLLRYLGCGIGLALIFLTLAYVVWAMLKIPDINKRACWQLILILCLPIPLCIYRLVVMSDTIPDLLYTGPGSNQSSGAKAAFYILHCLPEWAASMLLLVPNNRQRFGTGPWGDWRAFDGQKGCSEGRKAYKEAKAKAHAQKQEREQHQVEV